jgi:hypothetical protein
MVTVKRALDLEDIQEDLAEIFVTNHMGMFGFLFKEKDKEAKKQQTRENLLKAFCHAFSTENFYVALGEDQAIGMLGLSDNKKRAMTFNLKEFKNYFGGKGSLCYEKVKHYSYPISHYEDDTAFLEPVEILEEFKDQNAEEELINYAVSQTQYRVYITEVFTDQEELYRTYRKCGFVEIERHLVKDGGKQRYSAVLRKIKKI